MNSSLRSAASSAHLAIRRRKAHAALGVGQIGFGARELSRQIGLSHSIQRLRKSSQTEWWTGRPPNRPALGPTLSRLLGGFTLLCDVVAIGLLWLTYMPLPLSPNATRKQ
jgi:hypothetical protein